MKNKKVYLAKLVYSLYMVIIMGFIITSGFLVVITNIDKYFFNSLIGIGGDWLYYTTTILLIPIFGTLYVYNKRIVINDNMLEIRENTFSLTKSKMEISKIENVSLYKQETRRRIKKGIEFTDEKTDIMIFIKPFSDSTLSELVKDLVKLNPNIIVDDYYLSIIKSN